MNDGRRRRVVAALVAVASFLALAGCQSGLGTVCSGETVDTPWTECGDNAVEDQPRLANGELPRNGSVINAERFNHGKLGQVYATPYAGYLGTMRVDFRPDPQRIAEDMENAAAASSAGFDPEEKVKVDLKAVTIDTMLKQLLGGALRATYVAPDGLQGTITFRTEQPVPKAQLVQIVRDLLAREGLVLMFQNGVFHVGNRDQMLALRGNGAAGREGDIVLRTIPVRGKAATKLADLAVQLVPQTVKVVASSDKQQVIIQGTEAEVDQAAELVRSLEGYGAAGNRIAVVPVRAADPKVLVERLGQFYSTQFPDLATQVTLVPLPEQQAILAGADDASMMPDLLRLIQQLDTAPATEAPALRIIPLKYLAAAEAADQLGKIVGDGGVAGGPPDAPAADRRSGRNGERDQRNRNGSGDGGVEFGLAPTLNTGTSPLRDDDEGLGGDLKAPRITVKPAGERPIDNEGALDPDSVEARFSQSYDVFEPNAAAVSGGGGLKIVANDRSNALVIQSTYAVYQEIRALLETLDVPQAQVVIEATVVEVDLNDAVSRGVQFFLEGNGWSLRSASGTRPTDPGTAGGVIMAGGDLGNVRADVVLNALQAVTRTKVISSPYLTVVDGRAARLNIGDQIPYAKTSQSSNNNGNVTVTQEIEIKDTGIILEVTPRVRADNSVQLEIRQQVSTPASSAADGDTTPIISTRDIESNIMVQSGRTAMLGGLIQDRIELEESGVPVFRSIPVVGEAFKQKKDRVRRVELLIMITPRVVRQSSQLEEITRQLRAASHTRPRYPAGAVVKP